MTPFLYSIIYVLILGILAHFIGEALPRRLFSEKKFPFKLYRFEKNGKIYEYVWIKKWKTKVPDKSKYIKSMIPKKVSRTADSESVDILVRETCVAEAVHKCLCVLGLGIYFFWKNSIGTLLALLFTVANIPFIIIQRYNRPHLVHLRERLRLREVKLSLADSDTIL